MIVQSCASQSSVEKLQESVRWYTGETGKVDDQRARLLLEESAEDGNPLSLMWMARVYSTGRMTFVADKTKAIEIACDVISDIETMADNGNPEAMLLLGTAYAEGLAKEVNPELAVHWYRQAAAQGNTLALHNLGNVYASGTGVEQSDELAAQWWLKAAEKGDAIPQLRLGSVYEQGRGVTQSDAVARYWYSESANRGNEAAAAALDRLSK